MNTPSEPAWSPRLARRGLVGLLALPLAFASGQEPVEPAPAVASADDDLPEVVVTRPKPVYRDHAAAMALLERWAAARPAETSFVQLGATPGGRALRGLLVGRAPAAEGGTPLAERPVVLFVGGIDGRSLHGSEAVLAICAELLADPEGLPTDLAILCLPWAAPDGLDAELAHLKGEGPSTGGRSARPADEDLDGLVDEDGPDDLDGDGQVLTMLVPDPAGPWRRATDRRFLVDADAPGAEGPRYRLVPEGRDDDNDGELNEDGPGGVRIDRNFPTGWRGPHAPFAPGPWPLSEPESAGLAGWIASHDVLAAFLLDGHSGAVEWTATQDHLMLDADGELSVMRRARDPQRDERLAALGSLALGVFDAAIPEADGDLFEQRPVLGSLLEYLDQAGIPALRLATWGPHLGLGRSGSLSSAAFRQDEPEAPGVDELEDFCEVDGMVCPGGRGTAWRRYLDDRRGGIGFVDWYPVELEGVGTVHLGGWEAACIVNPPEDQLGLAVDLGVAVKDALLAALPRFELAVLEAKREGSLVTLRARAETAGALPAGFLDVTDLELLVELPAGARVVAGPSSMTWSADGAAPEAEWLVHTEEPGAFRLVLSSTGEDGAVVLATREVRP